VSDRRASIVFLLLLVTLGPAVGAFAAELLPSELCGNFFLVPIELSGDDGRRLWMLLDTGAEHTVIDIASVRRMTGKSPRSGRKVSIRDATAGPLRIHKLTARAHDIAHLSVALGRPIDGILGYDTFKGMLLTLDYLEGEVRVDSGRLPDADGKEIFALRGKKRPYLQLTIEGEEIIVLIDSGSGSSLTISPRELPWQVPPRIVGAYARFKSIELREAGRLAGTVLLGPTLLDDPIVELTDDVQLIGTAVLKHFRLTIDVDGRRMRMEPEQDGTLRLPPSRGTGALAGPQDGQLEILKLVSGGPAEGAGLEPGDVILEIDGLDVRRQGCERRNRDDAELEKVTYRIRRNGKTFDVEVPLVDLVP